MAEAMDSQPPERILGIDPGLNVTGYGVLDADERGLVICEAGVVRARNGPLEEKGLQIHDGIARGIEALKTDRVAREEL